jgi:hypothetical protein
MDKTKLPRVKVYINHKGRRVVKKALVLKENDKTIWVVFSDGNIVKRHKYRDVIGG